MRTLSERLEMWVATVRDASTLDAGSAVLEPLGERRAAEEARVLDSDGAPMGSLTPLQPRPDPERGSSLRELLEILDRLAAERGPTRSDDARRTR